MTVQVYPFPTLVLSPLPLYLPHYYFPMCYMCPQCQKSYFSRLCVPLTLLMSYFFYSFFQVQDRHIGVTLVRRQLRDGVYYGPKSVPIQSFALVLSSSVPLLFSTISMWNSHLGHPSLHIFHKFIYVLNISFLEEHLSSFSCAS